MRRLLPLHFKLLTQFFISDRLERILFQLSEVFVSAINTTHPRHGFIPHVLRDLIRLESRPECLAEMAYEWCSVICEHQRFEDWESLLLDCLEIGFRHLDSWSRWVVGLCLTHTEHHRGLADAIFKSRNSEAIADLLRAWTAGNWRLGPAYTLLSACTGHLIDLHNLVPFSSKLRRLVIHSVELIGYEGFEEVGMERLVELLNYLRVDIDTWNKSKWISLLLDTIRSPEEAQNLSNHSWELLVELAISELEEVRRATYDPQVMASLSEAHEWDKLECWMGVVWMAWPPETEEMTEGFERVTVSLLRHRPGATQKLTQWVKRWNKEFSEDRGMPRYFELICNRAHEAAQQD